MARKPSKLIQRLEMKYHRKARWYRFQEAVGEVVTYVFFAALIGFAVLLLVTTPSGIAKQYPAIAEPAKAAEPTAAPKPQTNEEILRVTAKGMGLTDRQTDQLVCIAKAESGIRNEAVGLNKDKSGKVWSKDYGMLQINDYYHTKKLKDLGEKEDPALFHNPFINAKIGVRIYKEGGPSKWSVYSVKGLCH